MKRIKPAILISISIVLILAILWLVVSREKVAVIILNGDVQGVTTHALTVKSTLEENGIQITSGDIVDPPLSKWISNKEIITITQASKFIISQGDDVYTTRSTDRNLTSLLTSVNLPINEGQIYLVNGKEYSIHDEIPYSDNQQIEIRSRIPVQFSIDQNPKTINSASPTFAQTLWQEDIPIYSGTINSPLLHQTPLPNVVMEITSGNEIQIKSAYRNLDTKATGTTVGHALAQTGTPLQFLDFANPGENELISGAATFDITNVEEKISLDQQIINFDTQRQPVPDLEIDNQTLVQAGEYGLEAQRIRVRYENGKEVSRKVEDKWTAREPVPRIEGYGSNIVIRTTKSEHGTIEYWRALDFYATSYSAARSGVSPDKSWFGHVYCGGLLKKGFVAVDLNYIPCGTQMYIPGYGYATAMDTGGISGAWIDLGYDDNNYVAWHQNVTVYFLTPIPPLDSIAYTIPPGTTK